ncbi:MAG: methyltransferase domain-containing protein [Gemmataceae bacterium]
MTDLSRRTLVPELMDQPGLDPREHARALRALARINTLSRSAHIFWPQIARLAAADPGRTWRLLDVASGGGDVPIQLWLKAKSHGIRLHVRGADVSPVAVDHARARAARLGAEVDFQQLDALVGPLPDDVDLMSSSLFLHHLNEDQAVHLLRAMAAAARRLVLINDLRRSAGGLALAQVVSRLVSRSAVVHFDAPQSVRAAFTLDEARQLAARAELHGATVRRRWPFRFLLTWARQ